MNFNNISLMVRRSARLVSRFRPGRAVSEGAAGTPAAGSRVRLSACSVVASASSGAPHRAAPRRVRTDHGGVQFPGCSVRTVRIVLNRCDRLAKLSSEVRTVRVKLDRCDDSVGRNRERENEREKRRPAKRVRFADPIQSHLEIEREIEASPAELEIANECRISARSTGIRILQLNMRRSAVVSGEVRQLVSEKRLDVLLLQEPYVRKQNSSHTFYGLGRQIRVAAVRSQRPWAAVAVSNPEVEMLFVSQLSTTHCVCAEVQAPGFSFYVASCYFQYSDEIEEHLRHLEKVCHSLRGKRLIVAVDSNARSSLWGPQETDERGAQLEDLIRSFSLQIVNDADQPPTYWTARGSSFIDVTLASPAISQFVGEWRVRQDWTTSDHNSIDIRLRVPRETGNDRATVSNRYDTRRADWEQFAESLRNSSESQLKGLELESRENVEIMAEKLTVVLQEACDASMPKKRRFRKSNPWWTKELTISKKLVYRLRRKVAEGRNEPNYIEIVREYRVTLRKYTREVKKTKKASWQEFVTSHGNAEAWGIVYKQQADKLRVDKVLSTLRRGEYSTVTLEETASYLLETHVPDDRENEDSDEQKLVRENSKIPPETDDAPFFTEQEVIQAVKVFKNNKAPGPDLIEVSVLKAACRVIPDQIVRLFNGCLKWGVFPSVWKVGSLRALLKGEDKDERDPKSYRPICLLSVVGKLFERLLNKIIIGTSLAPENASGRQYGFTPGRSTEDAVVELRRMVSSSEERYAVALLFDISGAFDNVWWPLVLANLKDRNCPKNVFEVLQSYFSGRRVQLEFASGKVSKQATRGCPQGSVLGPACWNVMFDGLLRKLEEIVPNKFAAYADDLIVVISGNSRNELEKKGQEAVDRIVSWCESAKLDISKKKTEAIVLKNGTIDRNPIGRRGGDRPDRKRKNNKKKADLTSRPPTLKIGEDAIKFKETVRYLGVHFDRELKVRSHCQYLDKKVESLFSKLGRLARATWGLKYRALSTIYRGVFAPTVAYAAAGWADLCTESDIRKLKGTQRKALIPVVGSYRTASGESLCVVAGETPVDILLQEARAKYEIRKGRDARIGNVTIAPDRDAVKSIKKVGREMWQAKWDSSTKGRTTYSFFNKVSDRVEARWVQPNRYSAQLLTGHGDFRARLASLGLAGDGACACGGGEDTVSHHILECRDFEAQRVALREQIGEENWSWPEVAPLLVSTPEAFSLFSDFSRETLWIKGFNEPEDGSEII